MGTFEYTNFDSDSRSHLHDLGIYFWTRSF